MIFSLNTSAVVDAGKTFANYMATAYGLIVRFTVLWRFADWGVRKELRLYSLNLTRLAPP